MLDQLTQFVKEQAGSVIQNNNEIPAEKKEQATQAAGASVTEAVQQNPNEAAALQNGGGSLPAKITEKLSEKLSGLGISPTVAGSIVPAILAKFQNGGFNFQEMFEKLKGADGEFQVSDLKNVGDVFSNDKPQPGQTQSADKKKDEEGFGEKLKNLF